jgi:Protein of unknown function (DUF2892)
MTFARFMAQPIGRAVRIIAGLVIVGFGSGIVGGPLGWAAAIIGLVPLAAGSANMCLIAPLVHAPLRGQDAAASV